MNKTILLTGIVFGCLAIILGAFGAHSLKELLDADSLSSFETGVRYQMYHALFLMIIGSMNSIIQLNLKWVYYLTTVGVVFFSFSIYFLSTSQLTGFEPGLLVLVTPFGGVLLITAWLLLGYRVFKQLS